MASGCISTPRVPAVEGLESFEGSWYHTGNWPHEPVDFTGRRVGIIGTGSSGIQAIPVIAEQAAHLTVFQRTANFSIPNWDGPLDSGFERKIKSNYPAYRQKARESRGGNIDYYNPQSALEVNPEERRQTLEKRWAEGGLNMQLSFGDLLTNQTSNDLVAEFVHDKIRAKVDDPTVAELLPPGSSFRDKTFVPGHQLLRDLQPRQRDAGRHQAHPHRDHHTARTQDRWYRL